MKQIFFPGCRIKAGYPNASEKLKQYMKDRWKIDPVGCCKEDHVKIEKDDEVLLICNNCSHDLESLTKCQNITYIYEIIDADDSFIFPDYHGKVIYLQDCFYGYRDHFIDQTVRSLLKKMNITIKDGLKAVDQDMDRKEHRHLITINAPTFQEKEVITYCAICNLAYKNANKQPYYLLDLLFGVED